MKYLAKEGESRGEARRKEGGEKEGGTARRNTHFIAIFETSSSSFSLFLTLKWSAQ